MNNRLPPITKQFTDEATPQYFQFTFYCDCCGEGRQTPKYPFSAADKVTDFDSFTSVQKLIYKAEYDDAYEQANKEVIGYFLECAKCGKYICEDCMLKSHPGEIRCPGCLETKK